MRALVSLLAGIGLLVIGAAVGYAAASYQFSDEPVPLSQGHITVELEKPSDAPAPDQAGAQAQLDKAPAETPGLDP